ncbi:MAG: winged helix DNA-binding domain-containing protein [Chloroflexi bacterium]|nr:winged helix DNA-binding domain-containing protein [Chloroflexota bacterium]
MRDFSSSEARRIALGAQGFADPRPRGRIDIRHLRRVVDRIGLIQIDSVNVAVRSHYMPLFSRLGPYPMSLLDDAVYGRKELFETWAHEASFVPVKHYPLFRQRMQHAEPWRRIARFAKKYPGYLDAVLEEVRSRGALAASELEDPGSRTGPWWGQGKGKVALEWHFSRGAVCVCERRNFARVYDLTERVLPPEALNGRAPDIDGSQRELLLLSARSHGVGTARDLADYYRLSIPRSRELLRELASEGALREVNVEGWRDPAYLHPEARLPRGVEAQALLTPFDSLIWERDRTERVFDFHYRIEIYVPQKKRRYGYYVMPFLFDEALAARVDLKSDRAKSRLLVKAAYLEEGQDAGRVSGALAEELRLMAEWLGLEEVRVGRKGDLAPALRSAV